MRSALFCIAQVALVAHVGWAGEGGVHALKLKMSPGSGTKPKGTELTPAAGGRDPLAVDNLDKHLN